MKRYIFFLLGFGSLATYVSASASNLTKSENAGGMENTLGPALLSVLAPSQQKVDIEKSFASHTAKALKFTTPPQQLEALERMFTASITYEEKLLAVYTKMRNLARQMDTVKDAVERKRMSGEMRALIENYKNICEEREKAPVEAGLISENALEGLLAMPEIQAVKKAIKKLVLSQFDKHVEK